MGCRSALQPRAAQQLAKDQHFVGGTPGMVGVLHTWTRALIYHPHIHYVVPGGGLAADGTAWRPAREDFLLPVRALSVLFRAKFRDALRQTELFGQVPAEVWTQDWVLHCQPVGDGAHALKYRAPYIFRVAISNRRILGLEDGQVTFGYTDGRSGQRRTCTVNAEEFIRRFLQHVLPKGFAKVRYYGFYSPNQRDALSKVQQLLHTPRTPTRRAQQSPSKPSGTADLTCPGCGKPMQVHRIYQWQARFLRNSALEHGIGPEGVIVWKIQDEVR